MTRSTPATLAEQYREYLDFAREMGMSVMPPEEWYAQRDYDPDTEPSEETAAVEIEAIPAFLLLTYGIVLFHIVPVAIDAAYAVLGVKI